MNLHLLRLFVSVAVNGGFSRSAEGLGISQPAVSRGVRELEEQLGTPLLERGPAGIAPTEAGALVLRHALRLFAEERAAEEELAALLHLARGYLRIGASTTIATWYLPEPIAAFHRAHPKVEIQLRSANTARIVELLLDREIDLALVEGPTDHPGIVVAPWRDDNLIWIAAPDHPLAARIGPLDASDLADTLLVIREPGSGTRDVTRAALDRFGLSGMSLLEVGGTEAIKQIVATGIGIALVSEAAVRHAIASGRLRKLDVRGFQAGRRLTSLSIAGRHPGTAATAFARFIA